MDEMLIAIPCSVMATTTSAARTRIAVQAANRRKPPRKCRACFTSRSASVVHPQTQSRPCASPLPGCDQPMR